MKFVVTALSLLVLGGCASSDMADHPANPEIQREITQVVEQVRRETGTALYSDLQRLVAYDRLRSNAMWVLAQINDKERPAINERVDGVLRGGLRDDDATVRLEAAAGLASRGSWDVLPFLIDGLENGDPSVRYRCHEQLVTTTSKDFGFEVDGTPDTRKAAAARWRDWYENWHRTHG
jgi:HEAT repeat protein